MNARTDSPSLSEIIANYESRLNQLEHKVSMLEGRMPLEKWRRVFWWIHALSLILVPIVGAVVAYFVDAPWGRLIVTGALGFLIGRSGMEFFQRIARGPRPHSSILMDDHRT